MKSNNNFDELIKKSNREFIDSELLPFLQIPSSTLNEKGIKQAKDYIINYISNFCEEINEFPGDINPLILAKVKGDLDKYLLIYMMYDTQPINKEKEWMTAPFGAKIMTLSPPLDFLGDCILARGAYNSKTPLLSFLNVVKLLKKNKKLPISLFLLFDGEEEIGSPTLLKLLEANKNIFKDCIDAYYPSAKQDIKGNSILKLGYKGILSLTIKIISKNKEPHSAFSSMIANPAIELISLINTIYSQNEFHIESLKEPYKVTNNEKLLLKNLSNQLDLEKIKDKAGIVQVIEEDPKKAFSNYLFQPTFNISTLRSGYLEEGIKNMVPNQASCNIDIRFAHTVSVDKIFKEIEEKIDNFALNSRCQIDLIKNIGYDGSRVEKNSILVKSLIESFKGINTEIWPLSAAAAPLSMINKELGLNFITGGLGIGGFAHAPNEFIQLDSIINTRLSNYYFLKFYSNSLK